jgi:PAS domain S-box-containing protein
MVMNDPLATEAQPTANEDRHSEKPWRGVQRLMQVGYWEWHLERKDYRWCEEMYRIFNLSPQQGPPRTGTFFNGVHPEDRDKVVRALGQALVGKQPFDIRHRIVRPDGSVRSVHGKAEVIFEGGRPIRVVGSVQDITEQQPVGFF